MKLRNGKIYTTIEKTENCPYCDMKFINNGYNNFYSAWFSHLGLCSKGINKNCKKITENIILKKELTNHILLIQRDIKRKEEEVKLIYKKISNIDLEIKELEL